MSFSEICAQYKKIRCHSQGYVWSVPNTKKMVPFKKISSQIMNGLHTNHFCIMGTIMKFVINMEVLDAELERIQNRLAFSRYQMCITCNDHEYAPAWHSLLWVFDAGWLTLNAKYITRGMVKSRLTSCCCYLLTIVEPGRLHQDTD